MHSSEKMFLTFFNVGLSGPPKMSDFIMYSVHVWACTLYMRWIFLRSAFDRGWRIWWFKLIKNFTKKIYFLTGQNCLRKKKSWKKYFFVSCLDLPYALCQCSCPCPPIPLPAPLHPFAIICPTYLPVLAIELETARKSEKFHQNVFEKKYLNRLLGRAGCAGVCWAL